MKTSRLLLSFFAAWAAETRCVLENPPKGREKVLTQNKSKEEGRMKREIRARDCIKFLQPEAPARDA